MSSQLTNNNNYKTAPASPNPYISRKLNNINQTQVIKKKREDWMRLYHKTLMLWQPLITKINDSTSGKSLNRISSEMFTRELNKEPFLNYGPIYTNCSWSVLQLSNPALMSMLHPHVCLTSYSRPPCVFHVP